MGTLDIQHADTDWEHSLHATSLDIQHAETDWEHSLHATSLDIQHAESDTSDEAIVQSMQYCCILFNVDM